MALFLVRHARAGSRHRWRGDDDLRPLSPKGARQAKALPAALEPFDLTGVRRVYSSPSLRCVQTVQPLAEQLGLAVKVLEALREGHGPDAVPLARKWLSRNVVACSHGDVIALILASLVPELGSTPPGAKGSLWVLERLESGKIAARYLPPPA